MTPAEIRNLQQLSEAENAQYLGTLVDGDQVQREKIVDGNMHWVLRLIETMAGETEIPSDELLASARTGLVEAVTNYSDPKFAFAPDETLNNGYAIWWVRLSIAKRAVKLGYKYNAAANCIARVE